MQKYFEKETYLKIFIKKNYFLFFIIFSGFPLFFIPNLWDGTIIDYAFTTKNLSGITSWFQETSSDFQLIILYLIFFLEKITYIPHEFLFDFFTIITLILFSFECKKYSEIIFGFGNKWSNLCAIFVICFPVWHSLVAFNLGLYLICYYLALLGYRFFVSKKLFIKIFGILLILFSFSQKSNFSFVIGLCLAHNLMLFFNGQKLKKYSLPFIIILCISSYFIYNFFFPPYGLYEIYNTVKFFELSLSNTIENILNYLSFFIYYLWIPIIYILTLKFFQDDICTHLYFDSFDLLTQKILFYYQ